MYWEFLNGQLDSLEEFKMQSIENVLEKFADTPGGCSLSELRKLRSFLNVLQTKAVQFNGCTGFEPTTKRLAKFSEDVDMCYKSHENYKGI